MTTGKNARATIGTASQEEGSREGSRAGKLNPVDAQRDSVGDDCDNLGNATAWELGFQWVSVRFITPLHGLAMPPNETDHVKI